ncbi:hypothetical protein KKD03_02260 [Patescibacteria group bacterium]|nr:hypothetical protein [Patescibacteria group bacterium]
MQRGIVSFTNLELKVLHDLVSSQGCQNRALLDKISPVVSTVASNDPLKEYDVLVSENEAEIILDCMPMLNKDDDPDLVNARIKIQQFLAKSRFPESSS